jgi:hypothetical protein
MSLSLPENVCGRPVRDGNFFGRAKDVQRVWARLETDHVLLTAPRRVGKTSLMYALQRHPAPGWFGAVYFSAENAEDELDFVAKLFAAIAKAPGCNHVQAALRDRKWSARAGKITKIEAASIAMELRQDAAGGWGALALELEAAVCGVPPQGRLLVMIDELPVFLLRLLDKGADRAHAFLSWFRSFRQGRPERSDDVRWLLAGSIGLAPLARRQGWSALINDLQPFTIDALEPALAADLLNGLCTRHRLPLDIATRTTALARVGWPIPFFLQLLVAELRELPAGPIDAAGVEQAFQNLLGTASSKHFAPWWERLGKELGATDASAARTILACCAEDPLGAALGTIVARSSNHWAEAEHEERRSSLLETLEHDGYLLSTGGRWRFRSPLLREAWLARSGR